MTRDTSEIDEMQCDAERDDDNVLYLRLKVSLLKLFYNYLHQMTFFTLMKQTFAVTAVEILFFDLTRPRPHYSLPLHFGTDRLPVVVPP